MALMSNDPIQIKASAHFQQDLKLLAKRYRRIRQDIQPVVEQLQAGEIPGDQVPGVGYAIFKVRVKNSSIQKGKSGGYRLLYYLKTAENIVLITVYSKSDQGDIAAKEIRAIVTQYEQGKDSNDGGGIKEL
jgi:mRNA-degrading endonuclease RelE of RelBE toxin-antitoxin system